MTPEDLFKRLRDLAYNIVKLCGDLPPGNLSRIITFQILKSSFSAAANYRAACRGQSPKSFISKLSISFEESDETQFWLESIYDLEMLPPERVKPLLTEAAELASILGRSRKTAETNMKTAARK